MFDCCCVASADGGRKDGRSASLWRAARTHAHCHCVVVQRPLCEGPGERDRKLLSGEDDVFSWCALAGWEAHTEVVTAKRPTIIAFSHDFGANRFPTDLSKSIS